jgi:5-methylthioadenosine/S-adenosylhomocysteine deaminase
VLPPSDVHPELDILVQDGLIVTMDDRSTLLDRGHVAIKDGFIVDVVPVEPDRPVPDAREVIDASHHIVMPGLINGHTHAATVLFRGFADDRPLASWLEDYIWPAEGTFVEPQSVYWATLLALVEMIKGGTTTVLDMYFHQDVVARAVEEAGIRAVLGEVLFDVAGPVNAPFPEGLARTEELLHAYANHPLISPSVQPHSAYTVSVHNLVRSKALADEHGALLGLHLAETADEVWQIREKTSLTPVAFLHELNLLGERTVIYHGVHLDEEEMDILAETGASVIHCPEANLKLGSGIAPVPALRRHGVDVGLGTDGPASNNDFDLWGEVGMAVKLPRGMSRDLGSMAAQEAIEMATREGSRALGLADRVGSLTPGRQADLILIDLDQPHLTPMYDPISHLAYAVGRSDVRTVIVRGRVLMKDRELQTIDRDEVMSHVRKISGRIADWLDGR